MMRGGTPANANPQGNTLGNRASVDMNGSEGWARGWPGERPVGVVGAVGGVDAPQTRDDVSPVRRRREMNSDAVAEIHATI